MIKTNKDVLVVHCTQASKSGAAKYVSEFFSAMQSYLPSARLLCPENFDFRDSFQRESVITFQSMAGAGRLSKLLSMLQQCIAIEQKIQRARKETTFRKVVVHFNFPPVPILTLPLLHWLKLRGVGVVLTVHDVFPHRWLLPTSLRKLERAVLVRLYRSAHALVVHHESQREMLRNDCHVESSRINLAPHGVFGLAKSALPYVEKSDFEVLCFGAIRENKGVHVAIEAVQRLRSNAVPVRLVIAGAVSHGERRYWDLCKELIGRRPEGIDVQEGFIPESEILPYFERSHIVLLPYKDFSSQSGVATMALSSGRAIVSSSAGGLADFLRDESFGVEIKDVSVEGVMSALVSAIGYGHQGVCKMGVRAFMHMEKCYSWATAAEIQLGVYSKVLEEI